MLTKDLVWEKGSDGKWRAYSKIKIYLVESVNQGFYFGGIIYYKQEDAKLAAQEHHDRLVMGEIDMEKLREKREAAFIAGFRASHEGWNGEEPFDEYSIEDIWAKISHNRDRPFCFSA